MRGKILRDTNAGPGLLTAGGSQYPFVLEGVWKSDLAPSVGMVVEVEVTEGKVVSVTAVPDGQLAREQAEVALAAAKEKGALLASAAVARFGIPTLVAGAALVLGWWFLSTVSINSSLGGIQFTFWQLLGILNSGTGLAGVMERMGGRGASTGIYGLLAVAAVAGPFLPHFWKDRRAHLAGLLPLALILLVTFMAYHGISSSFNQANQAMGSLGGGQMRQAADEMAAEMRKAISLGMGAYLAIGASLYFAAVSARRYLVAGA